MEDLLWKKKSTKRFRYVMLFLIRLAEVLIASIIPSVMGLIIVIITPEVRVMQVIEFISSLVFMALNCVFWIRYIRHRPNLVEFYLMNGIVYVIYAGLSVVSYAMSDVYLYSILFSNLRGFEIFGSRTLNSLYTTHAVSVTLMFLCAFVGYFYFKYKVKLAAENGVEAVEMNEKQILPQQDNKEVRFLTLDEVNVELEREMEEAAELIRKETERVSDKTWDSEMVQGENGEISEAVPIDPDNDIDDSDYVSEAYAKNEMSVTMKYSAESLWNEGIYKGHNRVSEYEEEDYTTEVFEDDADDETLWSTDMYRGRGDTIEVAEEDDEDWYENEDYGDDGPLFNVERLTGTEAEDDDEDWYEDEDYGDDSPLFNIERLTGTEAEDDDGEDEYWYEDEDEDYSDDTQLFNIDYSEESDEYESVSLDEYDSDSLWGEITQGK